MNKTNSMDSVYDYYKLKKYIDPKRLYWWQLVLNKDAVPFIEKHINVLTTEDLKKLSRNPFAVDMLKRHISKISWNDFVNNPNAIHVIEDNIDLCFSSLDWKGRVDLLRHPNFIHIIKENNDKIIDKLLCNNCLSILVKKKDPIYINLFDQYMKKYPEKIKNGTYLWDDLCENPIAVYIIEQNLHRLTHYLWQLLATNINATHIVEKNLDKLDEWGWRNLSENPNAIHILEKNRDKINWHSLSANPNSIIIFEKFPEKITSYSFIDYENFSINSCIFELDKDAIRKRCSIYKEELIAYALHPSRINNYLQQGISIGEFDNYI
jgi:hypothetical protein